MTTRYESTYLDGEEPMTLIFPEGMFEAVPYEIRLLGPWSGCSYGNMASLKPAQRAEISSQGYTIVREGRMLNAA